MQKEILNKNPSAKLQVYAVWLPYFPGDARDRWSPDLLSDPRVMHYWDGEFTLGQWLKGVDELRDVPAPIVWDTYALYGPQARWEEVPDSLVGWGFTVLGTRDKLRFEIGPFLPPP